ncbi:MAG: protein-lysine N-methyltransferase [Candidatus Doudnabacteria bacterium]
MIYIFFVFILTLNLSVLFYLYSLVSAAPFVSVPKRFLPEILEVLNLNDNSILFDLGSGDGRVLLLANKKYPKAYFVGVDKNLAPILFSRIRLLLNGNPQNVKLIRGDIFNTDFSSATHIFLYLFPKLLEELLPIFKKTLKPGTRVVSCNFRLSMPEVGEVILGNKEDKSARKLYIYEF